MGFWGAEGKKGFSLVELLIVLALIGALLVIGVPALIGQLSHMRLTRGARDVAVELNAARLKAISQNTKYRLQFTLNSGVTPDTMKMVYWNGAAWVNDPTRPTREIPAGANITAPAVSFNVVFFPNGRAAYTDTIADNVTSTSVNICVHNSSNASDVMGIHAAGFSGNITVTSDCTAIP